MTTLNSTEQLKDRSRRMLQEPMQHGKLEVYDEVVAPEFVSQPLNIVGIEALKQTARTIRTAFPDLEIQIGDQVAEDNRVATQVTYHGTHEGYLAMFDLQPTGKPATFSGLTLHHYQDGKIVKGIGVIDLLTLLKQLGAVPTAA